MSAPAERPSQQTVRDPPPEATETTTAGDRPVRARLPSGLVTITVTVGAVAVLSLVAGPFLPLPWILVAATGLALAAWWTARRDLAGTRRALAAVQADRDRQAQELERVADAAWELREGEERYRSLVDAQGDLVIRRSRDGRVTFVNDAFVATFGGGPHHFLDHRLDVGQPPVAPIGADVRSHDLNLETVAGRRWFSWVDIPERSDDGRVGGCLSVARDITGRKASEHALLEARRRAEAASEAKSRLLATVSHEFRTPLNGILGLTELLSETGVSTEQQTYIRGVQSSGETLLALVDDMLDFSRIEAGRLDLRPEATSLEPLVRDLVELLAVRAHDKDIEIAADVPADVPAVMVDPVRLRQVLTNLAGNGIKFTDTGGVLVSVRTVSFTGSTVRLRFAVGDTGPGIPADEAERLFGEFEQRDAAPGRRHGGAGLGLAISRRLVRQMGGDLALAAATGQGTTFAFELDLPRAHGVSAAETDSVRLDGQRILVAGPDGIEAPLTAGQLAALGGGARVAETPAAAGGLLAAAAVAGQPYHAILVDSRFAADAATALQDLRGAAGADLPAAVLIGPGERAALPGLRAAGYAAYLVRPIRRASLARIVHALLATDAGFLPDPRDEAPAAGLTTPAARPVSIQQAEDNEINALLARAVLEKLGHAVTEVRDGAAALAAYAREGARFGAILMDLHMPGIDGLVAARRIREAESRAGRAPVPILAVTADVLPQTRVDARSAGITEVVEKPLTPETLRRALASALSGQTDRDQASIRQSA